MNDITVWVEVAHHAAFRVGGWAYVRQQAAAVDGAAGGDRTPGAERVALTALAAALAGLPKGVAVSVATASASVAGIPGRIAGFAKEPPAENLELWAEVSTALKERTVRFTAARPEARSPTAFALAWSELARDKAKATGAFRSPIPKTNLVKAGV